MFPQLFDGRPDPADIAVAAGFSLFLAYLLSQIAARLTRRALGALVGDEPAAFGSPLVRKPIRTVRAVVFAVVLGFTLLPALKATGIDFAAGISPERLATWAAETGLRIAMIALGGYVLIRLSALVVSRFEYQLTQGTGLDIVERGKRARTLGGMVHGAVIVLVTGVVGLMILRELDVDIMPVLTGAGIVGLAVGFGAQTLVRDVIAGFFLILENQIRVGDVAVINGTGGLVEQITVRTVVLRDLAGVVHVFPNGAIERLANMTREFSYYVIDVGVAYKEDTDRVVGVLRRIGDELMQDETLRPSIIEPLEILGVDEFGDSQVTIKVRIKTMPLKQWEVGRELRRRIKKTFDAEGIEIPFPHVTVYPGSASGAFKLEQLAADGK